MNTAVSSFQTTELGPALARRSQWVSVPGAPLRATFSDAHAGPLACAALGSPRPPRFHAAEGTLSRTGGSRWRTERQHVLCDRHLSDASPDLSALGRGAYLPRQNDPLSQGLFSLPVCVCQDQPGYLSERFQITSSGSIQTSNIGGFLCDTISSEIETGRSQ